jgi:hypothetical protein
MHICGFGMMQKGTIDSNQDDSRPVSRSHSNDSSDAGGFQADAAGRVICAETTFHAAPSYT